MFLARVEGEVIVAGDDSVVFLQSRNVDAFIVAMKSLASLDKDPKCHGLG